MNNNKKESGNGDSGPMMLSERVVRGSVNSYLMSGSIEVSFSLRLGSASNLLLYLVLMTAREEKPFSHKYVVANGRRKRTALSESAGYSQRRCIQKSSNVWPLKADFNVSTQDDFAKYLLPLLVVTAVSQCRFKIMHMMGTCTFVF